MGKSPGSDRSAEAFVTLRPWGFFWLFLASAASRKVQLGWKVAGDFESRVDARCERLCPCLHAVSLAIGNPAAGRARLFRMQSLRAYMVLASWLFKLFPLGFRARGMRG